MTNKIVGLLDIWSFDICSPACRQAGH